MAGVRDVALPLRDPADLDPLLERIGDARIVAIGEVGHDALLVRGRAGSRPAELERRLDHRAVGVVHRPEREAWGNDVPTVLGGAVRRVPVPGGHHRAPAAAPGAGRRARAAAGARRLRHSLPHAAEGRLAARPLGAPAAVPFPPGTRTLELGLHARVQVLVPDGPPRPRPLLGFFHGAGGTPAQGLAAVGDAAVARDALVLAPASVASTWDLIAGGLGRDVAVLDAALEHVFARQPVTRVALGGFSDGASYALSLGLANGDLAEAVLAFSPGFAVPRRPEGRPRIWISHGTDDRVLPVARCGRRLAAQLGESGYDVTYEEFDGGHVVRPEDVTAALTTWLGEPG